MIVSCRGRGSRHKAARMRLTSWLKLALSGVGVVLAVICWARAPRGDVTRQGVVLTDLQSLLNCQLKLLSLPPALPLSLSLSLSLSLALALRSPRILLAHVDPGSVSALFYR